MVAVHHACVDPGPPVARPDPGTPRASYCATADVAAMRIVTVALAAAVVGLAAAATRRRPLWSALAALLVALALVADAVVSSSLEFALTI